MGLTLVWWRVPITFIFWISSSYGSENVVIGLKFTGIDTGWHWAWSFVVVDDDEWDKFEFFLNACETTDESPR